MSLAQADPQMSPRQIGRVVVDAALKFNADSCTQLGAALAYYTALSLSPLLLVVVAIAGLAFGRDAAREELIVQFRTLVGPEGAEYIGQLLSSSASQSRSIVSGLIALATLLYGASGVFAQLQTALNAIWKVPGRTESAGLFAIVKERLLSFSMVCGTAFLLLVSLVTSAALAGLNAWFGGFLSEWATAMQILHFVVGFVLTATLFALIFKLLPDTRLSWSDVAAGAIATAGLFSLGRYLIGIYLGTAAVGSAYGAAGTFVVLLVWVYYSTLILLFGAELTFVYATRYGRGPRSPRARAEASKAEHEAKAEPAVA